MYKKEDSRRSIAITAQSFGFGPASKAVSIAAYIRRKASGSLLHFFGSSTALSFALANRELFDTINDVTSFNEIDIFLTSHKFQQVVSVMEPQATLLCASYKIPVINVDSLYWFWSWPEIVIAEAKESLRNLQKGFSVQQILNGLHPHIHQYLSHLVADKIFIQCSSKGLADHQLRRVDEHEQIIPVGPIVDDRFANDAIPSNHIMLTFCGQLNPLVSLEQAEKYALFCFSLIEEGLESLLQKLPDATIRIVGHEPIMQLLRNSLPHNNRYTFAQLSHADYLEALNTALIVLGPASLTTVFETFIYKKPFIFLPEQHDGHWPNFVRLTEMAESNNKTQSISSMFPNVMFAPYFNQLMNLEEKEVSTIYSRIEFLLSSQGRSAFNKMKEVYAECLPRMANETYRKSLASQQHKVFSNNLSMIGSNGAATIADYVLGI